MPVSRPSVFEPSTTWDFVFSTSLMRSAETCACGSSMKIITSIMNDMTTYVAYVLNTSTFVNIVSRPAISVRAIDSTSAAPTQ